MNHIGDFSIGQDMTFPIFVQDGLNDNTPVDSLTASSFTVYILPPGSPLVEVTYGSTPPSAVQYGIGSGTGLYSLSIPASYLTQVGVYGVVVVPPSAKIVLPFSFTVIANQQADNGTILRAKSAALVQVSALKASDAANHFEGSYFRLASGDQEHQYRKVTVSTEQITALTAGAYDDVGNAAGDHYLYTIGAFADYTWASGDKLKITGGTGITPGVYEIASKVDDDGILLTASAGSDAADVTTENVTQLQLDAALTGSPATGDHVVLIGE